MKFFLGISWSAHPMLINLFILADVNMGWRFFSRHGAAIITNSISEKMHDLLLQHIRTMDGRLGIIIDGSTDHNNNHLVTVLFQLLENNSPKCHFYRMLKLGSEEDAEAHLNILIKAFEDDNILGAVRDKLISYTSGKLL